MRLRLAVGTFVACLFLLQTSTGVQAGPAKMPPSFLVQGKITQLLQLGAPNTIRVTVRNDQNRLVPFLITNQTVITYNNKPGTMQSLRVGDTVQAGVSQSIASQVKAWSAKQPLNGGGVVVAHRPLR